MRVGVFCKLILVLVGFFAVGWILTSCRGKKQLPGSISESVSASQGGASPLFFTVNQDGPQADETPFEDKRELIARGGLPNFNHRARKQKELTVAFLGGSITQNSNMYRTQTARFLQKLYPGNSFRFINAGVSGTGTDLGACRAEEQVLVHKPDLVFVDFAVNGAYAPGMEGIIRKIKSANSLTDICLLYMVHDGQTAIYNKAQIPEHLQVLDSLASHYRLPSVHLGVRVAILEKDGKLLFKGDSAKVSDKLIFSEGIHPYTRGGNIYAGAIARSLSKMKSEPGIEQRSLPEKLFPDNWEAARMLRLEQVKFDEYWHLTGAVEDSRLMRFGSWFPKLMQSGKPGAAFSFRFEGNRVGVFDIGGPEVGQLEVYVDGVLHRTVNRFNRWCNNRYRGQFVLIDVPHGRHDVKMVISASIPDKKEILGGNQLADITAHPNRYNQTQIYLGRILLTGEPID